MPTELLERKKRLEQEYRKSSNREAILFGLTVALIFAIIAVFLINLPIFWRVFAVVMFVFSLLPTIFFLAKAQARTRRLFSELEGVYMLEDIYILAAVKRKISEEF